MKGALHFTMKMLLLLVVVAAAAATPVAAAAASQEVKSVESQKEFDKTIVAENDPSYSFGSFMALVSGKAYHVKNLISNQFTATQFNPEEMAKRSEEVSETKFNENTGNGVFGDDASGIHGRLGQEKKKKTSDVKNIHGGSKTKFNENIGNGVFGDDASGIHGHKNTEKKLKSSDIKNIHGGSKGQKTGDVKNIHGDSKTKFNENIGNGVFGDDASGIHGNKNTEKKLKSSDIKNIHGGSKGQKTGDVKNIHGDSKTKTNENIGKGVFEHDKPPIAKKNAAAAGRKFRSVSLSKTNENIGNGVFEHDKPPMAKKNAAAAGRKFRSVSLSKE